MKSSSVTSSRLGSPDARDIAKWCDEMTLMVLPRWQKTLTFDDCAEQFVDHAANIVWNDGRDGAAERNPPARPVDVAAAMDGVVSIAAVSNDTAYLDGRLWNMFGDALAPSNPFGSQANEAWEAGHVGSMSTIVGVADTGLDYAHADLYRNVWLNQREIPATLRMSLSDVDFDGLITFRDLNDTANAASTQDLNRNGYLDAGDLLLDRRWNNGVDDDANGYLDDLIGWDFVNNDNDPFDDNGHGTHVSGTIGAIGGNGVGVAGVNWNVQVVGMKFLSSAGSGNFGDAIKAIDYFTAAARNASLGENYVAINNSWGGGGYLQTLSDAITRAARQDILFVAAAGNNGCNNDVTPSYPSNYSTQGTAGFDAVVAVASLTSSGTLSSFSNYGRTTVDLAAPGSSIVSTLPGNQYGTYSGTSMAAPHVTGALALYAAAHPEATASQLRSALLSTTALTSALIDKTVTGGRLDVGALLNAPLPTVLPPSPQTPPTTGDQIAGGTDTTATLQPGTPWLSSVETAGDQDWFRVTFTAGMRYDIALDAVAGSALDPLLRIFDATGAEIMANDDAVGLDSRLSFASPISGTYFVSAGGWGDATGGYRLSMSEIIPTSRITLDPTTISRCEGNEGTTEFRFIVVRGGDLLGTTTTFWSVSGAGGAPADATDFADAVLPSGQVTFLPGETTQTITVPIAGDSSVEPIEAFLVTLSSPSSFTTITNATARGLIQNDDARLALSNAPLSQREGHDGLTRLAYTVTRTGNLMQASTVDWWVTGVGDNPASADDFESSRMPAGTVSFDAGQTIGTITVGVRGDAVPEGNEMFAVSLGNASAGSSILPSGATRIGTIVNDDSVVSIAALTPCLPEGDRGRTTFTFAIDRVGTLPTSSTVSWRVVPDDLTGVNARDFLGGILPSGTVTFSKNQTSAKVNISVAGDKVYEVPETFHVVLENPSAGMTLGVASATVVIENDDPLPQPDLLAAHARVMGEAAAPLSVSDTVTRINGVLPALRELTNLTELKAKGSVASERLELTGFMADTTIDMGGNIAFASQGLSQASLTFIGKPDVVVLGSGADTIHYAMRPSSGILTVADFDRGSDVLAIDLCGTLPDSLRAYDTFVGTTPATALFSTDDVRRGVILLGVESLGLLDQRMQVFGDRAAIM